MTARISVHEFDTPPQLFETLARVFGEQSAESSRWVKIKADNDVEVTFFARDVPDEPEPSPDDD